MLAPLTFALLTTLAQAPPAEAFDPPITRYVQQTRFEAESHPSRIALAQTSSRDPLGNGARIGAIIGGAIMAAGIGWLCYVTHEEGDPSCVPPVLLWTGIGAGAGALAGAGIDALFARRMMMQASVRF